MVDAAAARATRQLGVFPGGDGNTGFTIELLELLQHHGSRWHIDAQRQGFGGKHNFEQLLSEELLDCFFENRQHSRMVGCHAPNNAIQPRVIPKNCFVVIIESGTAFINKIQDAILLVVSREAHSPAKNLSDSLIASGPGKNKENRRQQVITIEHSNDVGSIDLVLLVLKLPVAGCPSRAAPPR